MRVLTVVGARLQFMEATVMSPVLRGRVGHASAAGVHGVTRPPAGHARRTASAR